MQGQENLALSGIGFLYSAPVEIKAWVRAAREKAKLTQTQLGDALSVTKGNVSGWENGRHSPSYDQLRSISKFTGFAMPNDDSAEGPSEESKLVSLRPRDQALGEALHRLADAARSCDRDARDNVAGLVAMVIKNPERNAEVQIPIIVAELLACSATAGDLRAASNGG